MIAIFTAHRDWVPLGGQLEAVRGALAVAVDAMHAYFSPVRFYSRCVWLG